MLIYFDSVIIIYLFDHTGPFNVRAVSRLAGLQAAGDHIAVTDLSRLECRVRPLRVKDAAKLAVLDGFFARPEVRAVPVTTAVFDRATQIRASYTRTSRSRCCRERRAGPPARPPRGFHSGGRRTGIASSTVV